MSCNYHYFKIKFMDRSNLETGSYSDDLHAFMEPKFHNCVYNNLGPPSGLLLSDCPTKILYAYIISLTRATCHSHPSLYHLTTLTLWSE